MLRIQREVLRDQNVGGREGGPLKIALVDFIEDNSQHTSPTSHLMPATMVRYSKTALTMCGHHALGLPNPWSLYSLESPSHSIPSTQLQHRKVDRNFLCPLSWLNQTSLWHSWLLYNIGGVDFLFCAITGTHDILSPPSHPEIFT